MIHDFLTSIINDMKKQHIYPGPCQKSEDELINTLIGAYNDCGIVCRTIILFVGNNKVCPFHVDNRIKHDSLFCSVFE